jgi:hypothetical protein
VLIPTVEQGLEVLLRATVPLPDEVGDVSFDPPSGGWSASLSRVTVNLFLYEVGRSAQAPRPAAERAAANGRSERRPPLPMLDLCYLVSAWAGSARDEHLLLGDVLSSLLIHQVLPPEHLPTPLASNVQLAVGHESAGRARDVWGGIEAPLRASFTLLATVALDTLAWEELAPRVERVVALTAPKTDASRAGRP